MSHYIHHVPGRLRVRSEQVRSNASNARRAEALLGALEGVTHTQASTVTGSIIVRYDPALTGPEAVLDSLRSSGYLTTGGAVSARPRSSATPKIAEKVAKYLLEKAVEQSLMAAVAAIL